MIEYYEFDDNGQLNKYEAETLPSGRFVMKDGKWLRKGEATAVPDRPYNGSAFACGAGVRNPLDGNMYYSKTSYEESVKRNGGKILGEDAPTDAKLVNSSTIDWKSAVAQTIKQLS